MSAITFQMAQNFLQKYLDALDAVLVRGVSYEISVGGSSRRLNRSNLEEIEKGIEVWRARCNELDPTNKRPRHGFLRVALGEPRRNSNFY